MESKPVGPIKKFTPEQREKIRQRVETALDRVRPALQADGGNVMVLDVSDEGRLSVRLTGACGGCPMSSMTLKQGIEHVVRRDVEEIREVVSE